MADKEQVKDTSSTATQPPGAPETSSPAGFGNILGMSTAWMEAMNDLSAELASFVAERIKQDVKTQHEMLHCKDIAAFQHIQAQFIQKALDQYHAETGKLVEIGNKAFTLKSSEG
ncbi:hypothetical protein Z946_1550 [Sulfitobacter noctilucicola]|uniref:Phasin domain-containing protein n=1 Tax=Sulfitobacter noctilucicola TaxID=1342301 RepID=A0A7W6Q4J4_9RHOB|nr:phasin family protein [Sulfitobacter noctilucicola]KIN62687.1 hypothetical protein Z946_1550 [Sulfitobacter noctilucicola]MBB4172780.1 hypothetical protein [Sulfitobacter noctilucicola]